MSKENKRTFTSDGMEEKCFKRFRGMKNREEFCDITFRMKDESISAHRVIITAAIPYFRKILSNEDADQEGICMPEIESNAFKCLIEYAYSCQVNIDAENVNNLLAAACYLEVDEVREACCDFLADGFEPGNVLKIRELACNLQCSELVKSIDYYVKENFDEISPTEDFLNCSSSYLKEIIGKDDLNVDSEGKLLENIIKWVKKSPEDRKNDLQELLPKIRLPLLDPFDLANIVEREELIRTSIPCRDLFDEARNYNLFPQVRERPCSFLTVPRQFTKTTHTVREKCNERIYKLYSEQKFVVQMFDLMREKWYTKRSYCFFKNAGSTLQLNNKIYFFDGDRTLQYNPQYNIYKYLEDVPTARKLTTVVSLHGKIYVCGGRVGWSAASNVVECFDPEKGEWAVVSSMNTGRWGASSVTLGEHLYVLGGQEMSCVFDSMERYDPTRNKWEFMSSMRSKRAFAGAATLNGEIYVCGGKTLPISGMDIIATAEMYSSTENDWKMLSPMSTVRMWFTLLSYRGKLYAVGGKCNETKCEHNFEIYDPRSGKWVCGPSTDSKYKVSGAFVM